MQLKRLKIYRLEIPLRTPFRIATGTTELYEGVIVKLETEVNDIYGWGEAVPSPKLTGESVETVIGILEHIGSKLLLGSDPEQLETITIKLDNELVGNTSAKACIDMAIHDILGKILNKPIRVLFGGNYRVSLRSSITVGIESVADAISAITKIIDANATNTIKLKIGIDTERDLELVKAVRAKFGYNDLYLRLDANQGYTVNTAIKVLQALERYEIEFVEQPVAKADLKGMAEVRRRVNIPLMADEAVHLPHDVVRIAELQAADLINIKLMKTGGLRNAVKLVNIADTFGLKCMTGCMVETELGISAIAQLALALAPVTYADLDGYLFLTESPVSSGARIVEGGEIKFINDRPGIGIEIDESKLSSQAVYSTTISL